MKTTLAIAASLTLAPFLRAQETDPEVDGLKSAASAYVAAYNKKDADALSKLFAENGEITTLDGSELTTGREAIKARYENYFATDDIADISIEVDSVRLVAPGLAIEDGTAHFTPAGEPDEPARSITYSAVLHKNDEGKWEIASSRSLTDVSGPAAQLAQLARAIKGEWTCHTDSGIRIDLAFGWGPTGKFLTGDMLVSASDVEPQNGRIRIGWNAARKSIVSWMFDGEGGVTQGIWTAVDDGWVIRSEGTTSDGEHLTANQKFTPEGPNTLNWMISNRMIDDLQLPDSNLRFVRPAPTPAGK